MAKDNRSIGRFQLSDIPPAQRGVPQIEVTFDIDANGILNVSAKDKGTGKEQKITIQANSGLTDAEIQQMIKDAEANAENDRKQKELVEARNQAQSTVHTLRKDLEEHASKLSDEDKSKMEDAFKAVDEAVKGEDKEAITDSVQKVFETAAPLYKAMSENQQTAETSKTDNVVDAEFTEVKDDKKAA
jgi:molecular chaperone DnaK